MSTQSTGPDTRPTTPATEAGRRLLDCWEPHDISIVGKPSGRDVLKSHILAIEAEAASPSAVTLSDGTMIPLTDAAAVIEESLAASPAALDLLEALRANLFPRGFDHPEHWSLTNVGAEAIANAARLTEQEQNGG